MPTRIILFCAALAGSACAGSGVARCDAGFAAGASASCVAAASGASSASTKAETLTSPAEYCTAESGFAAGARGEAYAGVCTGDASEAFLSAYGKGDRLFNLEREAIAASQQASDAGKDLWQVKRSIMEADARRLSSMTSRAERTELNIALKALNEERIAQQAEVDRLIARKAEAEQALAVYRDELAAEKAAQPAPAVEPEMASFP